MVEVMIGWGVNIPVLVFAIGGEPFLTRSPPCSQALKAVQMPNLIQTVFVSSSLVAFGTLFVLSQYILAYTQAQPEDHIMASVLAPYSKYIEYASSPSSLALILGGGFSLGVAWLLSVKHTRMLCSLLCSLPS